MGETQPQRIEIAFAPDTVAELARAVIDVTARIVDEQRAEQAPKPATTPYDLGLEPWAFHDPRQACEVVAYLDPQNQVRHVPTTRASEVPKAWRRMWLQPRE